MWQSKVDFMNDIAALNDFGNPQNSEPYPVLHSVGRGSKIKEKQLQKFIDPRTGEEIKVEQDFGVKDIMRKGRGRGAILTDKNYIMLQKQLRLARPLGSADEIIEAYCKINSLGQQNTSPPAENNSQSIKNVKETVDTFCKINPSKTRTRVKAVRSSNFSQNALITNLLKTKGISSSSSSSEIKKTNDGNATSEGVNKIIVEKNEVPANNFKNDYHARNKFSSVKSDSDDQPGSSTSEHTTSDNLCNSENNIYKEDCKSFSTGSSENFCLYLSFSEEDKNNELKKKTKSRDTSCNAYDKQNLERIEMYRKLGEKLHKQAPVNHLKRKEMYISLQKTLNLEVMSDDSVNRELVYDDTNFPSLIKVVKD